jgi:hypothetical protein
VKHLAYGFRLL